ncbi:hypothetical protein FA95DRAFT_1368277 [Auriscalpium vulgare]|uniref:Uncharacterized protein n=1 Tax=Auriscalpium vulgare TaxID=40419 RepID=A0ACB8RRH8_9AGAM|nr:hypothetical protein FA95DRAFT_1368277 [Auriscalpium vulgare]
MEEAFRSENQVRTSRSLDRRPRRRVHVLAAGMFAYDAPGRLRDSGQRDPAHEGAGLLRAAMSRAAPYIERRMRRGAHVDVQVGTPTGRTQHCGLAAGNRGGRLSEPGVPDALPNPAAPDALATSDVGARRSVSPRRAKSLVRPSQHVFLGGGDCKSDCTRSNSPEQLRSSRSRLTRAQHQNGRRPHDCCSSPPRPRRPRLKSLEETICDN